MFTKINLRILSAKERALLNAVSNEDLAKVKTLVVEDNVNINIRDSLERSPLMRTSFVADQEAREGMTKIFLQYGAEPNMVDLHGRSALMLACREENKEDMIKLLMQCTRTDPNLQDEEGNTALVQAIEYENVSVVRTLLKEDYSHRVDVNVENFESKTAIVIATKLKNKEICSLLTSTGNVNLSEVPNHLIEYLPEEFQHTANEAKSKENQSNSRSTSSNGPHADVHPSSFQPNDSLPPSPYQNPQTAADGTSIKKSLGGRILHSSEGEKDLSQGLEDSEPSTSPASKNIDNVDDKGFALDTTEAENRQNGEEVKDSKQEVERPTSKILLKESPSEQPMRVISEEKVGQKSYEDDPQSKKGESHKDDSEMLKEKEGEEKIANPENGTDDIKKEMKEDTRDDGITQDRGETARISSNEESSIKQIDEKKEKENNTAIQKVEYETDRRLEKHSEVIKSREEKERGIEVSDLTSYKEEFSGNGSTITRSKSDAVVVRQHDSQEVHNTSSIDSELPRKNTASYKKGSGEDRGKQMRSDMKEGTKDNQEGEMHIPKRSEDTKLQKNKDSVQSSLDNKKDTHEVTGGSSIENAEREQRSSSVVGNTKNSQEKESKDDGNLQRNKKSLQKTSTKNINTNEDQHIDASIKQHSQQEQSFTETSVINESKKTLKGNETRSENTTSLRNVVAERSDKDELKTSEQDNVQSSVESEKLEKTTSSSKPTVPYPEESRPLTNRSSPDQSISAASFTSEPPPGVQRSPEKPRGWTAPTVATVPTAVNKWKKRAKERRGSKGHRKRPLRVEDQTPYVTKSGRVIYPNSVHDEKYDDIQEVRTASRMSRLDMASQLMLKENEDLPKTHQRRKSRQMSVRSSKNTNA